MDIRKKKQFTPNQARNYRREAGLTQGEIAFLLDIKNVGRISEWENGLSNPSIEHFISLSLIYNRLPDELYYELRKQLSKKLEVRKKLLQNSKAAKKERLDSS